MLTWKGERTPKQRSELGLRFFLWGWGSPCQSLPRALTPASAAGPWSGPGPAGLEVSAGLCVSLPASTQALSGSRARPVSTQHISARTQFSHSHEVMDQQSCKTLIIHAFMQIFI